MPRVHELQAAFSAGEISERLAARLDFAKYPASLATCENMIPLSEGGAMRRPGTRYVAELKSNSVKGRLKKFQFSVTQAYAIELADSALRFYRNQARITVANTDAAVTNGTFTTNITGWTNRSTGAGSIAHDATNLDLDLIPGGATAADIGWAEQSITTTNTNQEHVIRFRVVGAPGDKIEFQVGTAASGSQTLAAVEKEVGYHCVAFTPTTSPFYIQFRNLGTNANKTVSIDDVSLIDNAALEITSPWPEAELYDVEGPQTADVLYLFHDTIPTYKLQRFGHTTWSLVEVAWQDGPYLDLNITTTTLTPSAVSGTAVTVTASSIVGINDNTGFQANDIGRLVRIDNPASGISWGWGIIVARTSTTVVTVHVKKAFAATTADTRWKLGAWSNATGFPSVATFFEQRLYAANTTKHPQTFWASQNDDFENQKPDNDADTVEADDAFSRTLSADSVDAIYWLSAGEDRMVIGTSGGEWVPKASGDALTATDISVRRQTKHGSAKIQPVRVGSIVLFVQRAKRKIREFGFSFQNDNYTAPDMSRLASHIMRGGVVEMDYAEEPESIVWIVRNDGQLLSMTYRRDEEVVGWGRHILGGEFYGSITKVWQVDASPETFVDETTDANSTANADWTVFPASEAVGDYVAFGHNEPFSKLVFDYANGTAGVGGAVTWEYWNGSSWTALSGVTDNTNGFTAAAADNLSVTWTKPTDWKRRLIGSGVSIYYVRARITTVYTTNPVLDQGFIPGNPVVESVTVIPGTNGSGQVQDSSSRDEVWLIVKRTINGSTKRYVEFFERAFETGEDQEDAYYVDSMVTYDGASATTLSGFNHLEGQTVKIWANGAIHPSKTVSSGQITLDSAKTVVQAGLSYTHTLKTLKIKAGNPAGTPVGKKKRIYGLTFVLLNSHTVKYGPDTDSLSERDFRIINDAMDAGAPLFTGEKFVEFQGGWTEDARIVIQSSDPVPFTLLAIAPEIAINSLK